MSSLGRSQYSFDDLKHLTSPFKVTETSMRTCLSRMIREGTIQSTKDGKTAFYGLSHKGKTISSNISLCFKELDWSQWDREWWGLLFSVPGPQNQQRHRIRKKLVAYRFASLYSGFWIRPLNCQERVQDRLSSLIDTENCSLIRFKFDQEITKENVAKLWKIAQINEIFAAMTELIEENLCKAGEYNPEQGLLYKLLIGNEIVNAPFNDPMLPDEFLPNNWKGKQLRKLFVTFDKTMTRIARPYVDQSST